jgi:hypothetical protein
MLEQLVQALTGASGGWMGTTGMGLILLGAGLQLARSAERRLR